MNKRAAFDFQVYLVAMLVVIGVLVTLSSAFLSMGNKYGMDAATLASVGGFNATYNRLDDIVAFTDSADNQMSGAKLDDEEQQNTFLGDMLSTGKAIYATLTLPFALVEDIWARIPIPVIWKTISLSLLIVLFITTFIFMVFGNKGTG